MKGGNIEIKSIRKGLYLGILVLIIMVYSLIKLNNSDGMLIVSDDSLEIDKDYFKQLILIN